VKAQLFIIIGWLARHRWQIVLFAGLLGLAVLALAFAHAWDAALPNAAPRARCFETFWTAKWPKWIGCAMAVHESLAAGLISLWAAIFAAWWAYSGALLAYSGIQMQIEEDRWKVALSQMAAKQAAVVAITQAIHAAAGTLLTVIQAQKAQDPRQFSEWDELIDRGVSFIEGCLNQFTVRDAGRDLGIADRVIYVQIVGTLASFVTINRRPSEHLDRKTRLQNRYTALMNLREYLQKFDSDLAAAYDRDAEIAKQG
jgi:hypothetical protein